jgi:hypothetical protein
MGHTLDRADLPLAQICPVHLGWPSPTGFLDRASRWTGPVAEVAWATYWTGPTCHWPGPHKLAQSDWISGPGQPVDRASRCEVARSSR